MLSVTKIFRFETAHAILGYAGSCKNIHGHSYVLHVTVRLNDASDDFLPAPGFVIDFKELKAILNEQVVSRFDHKIILSADYLAEHPALTSLENLETWPVEPTAENMLLWIRKQLEETLLNGVQLAALRLYETSDSFAEWHS
jgi:6-pyruvoyltetrahydropterin/6-carboxytetrahydropterin synthase